MHFSTLLRWLVVALFLLITSLFISRVYRTQISETRDVAAKEVRDLERTTHVNTISSAVAAYRSDHSGKLPALLDQSDKYICRSELYSDCKDMIDLRSLLTSYIVAIPSDPSAPTGANTYYMIRVDKEGQIFVSAPKSETKPILATR